MTEQRERVGDDVFRLLPERVQRHVQANWPRLTDWQVRGERIIRAYEIHSDKWIYILFDQKLAVYGWASAEFLAVPDLPDEVNQAHEHILFGLLAGWMNDYRHQSGESDFDGLSWVYEG